MDLNEILIFIRVVQSGSFNKAAERLGMPKSTVSMKISALEKRLGVTLLHRTTRKLNLTQTGGAFYQNALKHINGIISAESEASLNQGEPRGTLRITAPVLYSSTILPEIICEYSKKYPNVKIDVILSDAMLDLISGNIDVAIRAGVMPSSTLKSVTVGWGYFAPFVSPSYLKSTGKISHPRDLIHHTCIQYSMLNKEKWDFFNFSNKSKFKVAMDQKIIMNELFLAKELALQGYGVALLPAFLCTKECDNRGLVRILKDWHSYASNIHFVYPADKYVTPKLSAFIAIASEILKKHLKSFENK